MKNKISHPERRNGQRIFTCGHSFHFWVPEILEGIANSAGFNGHQTVGISCIGASSVIQHWDVPDEENEAKKALRTGGADVLTLTCMTQPDEGISNFAKFAVDHNPNVRITLQEMWLPEDRFPFDPSNRVHTSLEDFNHSTLSKLTKAHDDYFNVMEDYVNRLNTELGCQIVFIVPDAQAVLSLRKKIIHGTAPGLEKQSELFVDAWGHPSQILKVLSAYCHYSVIYQRSPIGLPLPKLLCENPNWGNELNVLLQELSWKAVIQHSLSGVVSLES